MKSVLTSDRCKLKHFSWRFCRSDASFKIPALFGHLQSNLDHKVEWVSTSGYCTVFVQAGLAKNCVIRDDLEDHYWTRDFEEDDLEDHYWSRTVIEISHQYNFSGFLQTVGGVM